MYLLAEIVGAFLASLFVSMVIGNDANLAANVPNYSYPLPLIFGIEVLASALLMAVILTVVYTYHFHIKKIFDGINSMDKE